MISARSIPFGIKVVGVIRYPCLILSPNVYGLTAQLHAASNVIGVAHSSSESPGEFLYLTVLTANSLGVLEPTALPEILEIETHIKSTSGISPLVI